jgi:hypothetical protein
MLWIGIVLMPIRQSFHFDADPDPDSDPDATLK